MVDPSIDSIHVALEEIPELPNKDNLDQQSKKKALEKLVSCGFCNRTFYESRLEGHKKICTKEKPFKPLSRKIMKNNSCFFPKNNEENPQIIPEIHENKEENIEKQPIYDEKEAFKEQILVKCEKCDRKFDMERIEKHSGICKGKKPNEGENKNEKKTPVEFMRKSVCVGDNKEKNEEKQEKTHRVTSMPKKSNESLDKGLNYNEKKEEKNGEKKEKKIEKPIEKKEKHEKNGEKQEKNEKNGEKEETNKKEEKNEKPQIINPLLMMKNYTRQLEERKKNSESNKKRTSTPQKTVSPKKSSNSPKKKMDKNWAMTESVIIKNFEDSIEKTLEKVLHNNDSEYGTPNNLMMKNCEYCGKMFPEKTVKSHAKICKNLSMKSVRTPKNLMNSKGINSSTNIEEGRKLTKRPSIMLKEENLLINNNSNSKNYKNYRSFQPTKLYEFKY